MTKYVGLRTKTYSYLIDDGREDKKAKGTKKCVIIVQKNLRAKLYKIEKMNLTQIVSFVTKENKKLIKNNKLILKTQQRFKSERHDVFTEKINKIALSSSIIIIIIIK